MAKDRFDEKSFGLVNRRILSGGTYGEVDTLEAANNLSGNPIEHWTQAYLRFTRFEGGDKIRSAMSTVMSTTGIVAALISTLVLAALLSPPICNSDIARIRTSCTDLEGQFITYGTIHIINLVNCLSTITYVTIASLWLGVHRDEEMTYFIVQYYVFAIAIPATCMSFAIVGTIAAELLRVWIVYGPIAFYIAIAFCGVVFFPCCWFATKIVFTTVDLRKSHASYQLSALKSMGGLSP